MRRHGEERPVDRLNAIGQSRKLTGLVLTVGALMIVLIVGTIAWAIWGVPTELFVSIGGLITGSGTAHQGAQMMADRSPNYPNVIAEQVKADVSAGTPPAPHIP
jgi:hypothetical protein